jgi:hypothetical protein
VNNDSLEAALRETARTYTDDADEEGRGAKINAIFLGSKEHHVPRAKPQLPVNAQTEKRGTLY